MHDLSRHLLILLDLYSLFFILIDNLSEFKIPF
jgi:hypothetical protein